MAHDMPNVGVPSAAETIRNQCLHQPHYFKHMGIHVQQEQPGEPVTQHIDEFKQSSITLSLTRSPEFAPYVHLWCLLFQAESHAEMRRDVQCCKEANLNHSISSEICEQLSVADWRTVVLYPIKKELETRELYMECCVRSMNKSLRHDITQVLLDEKEQLSAWNATLRHAETYSVLRLI
ncbi:hypothetical protein T03_11845 [Trichinella britovi]|uniref:Uncharacterized protein n=1 Tax=Trichinella britovi TaxID=45882 RepID=A0A0V1C4V0_TRIBR|nr:hypothetical protein T03_7540 [Trichinella britovi]KRY44174.1 hypothetical protein T03_8126 [Trichinella britovi]KRY44214.1 hypothetical protein T03_11845 [Trichinella britovi]